MDSVSKLRQAVELFSERTDTDRVIVLRGEPLTWGDLRAILALVDTINDQLRMEYRCGLDAGVRQVDQVAVDQYKRGLADAYRSPGVHCRSCDGHSCPDVG